MTTDSLSEDYPVYEINPAVAHREIEGQILLMLPGQFELFTLNATGRMVWCDIIEGRALRDTVRSIADKFGIPLQRAREDVESLIDDLLARNVIYPA